MKGKGRKKANWILDNIIGIFALFFEAFPTLIVFFRSNEVSLGFFCIIINISVAFFIYKILAFLKVIFEQYKRYKYKRRKLRDKAAQHCEAPIFDYFLCKEELWEDFLSDCLVILVKRSKPLLILIVTVFLVCICNPQNTFAYWNRVQEIMEFTSKEDNILVESNKDIAFNEPKETEKTVQEIRDTKWRFILGEPAYSFDLDPYLEKQVYFEIDKSGTEWGEYVQETARQWKGGKEGVNYTTIKDEEGNNFFTYTEIEDRFKERVEDASQYIYYDEWLKEAPHSFEYNDCIEGREILNKIEVDGKTGCYEIWWKLANDYQYYAQEYERQTANAEAVLYYYTKSIYCCMEALKYPVSEKNYNTTYHYMVMRYHDMYRNDCIISQEYKEKASSIYSILVKTDIKMSASN